MKKTLHIYTRVSTLAQQEDGTSLETQKEMGIEKAKQLGFDYRVWNEGGASSNYETLENRPVLLELLDKIQCGDEKHLWVYQNDRLSRNKIASYTIRHVLQKNSVIMYTKDGQFDPNSAQDELINSLMDSVAQFDNAQRADRTRRGKLYRVKQGFWHGGPAPFGYKIGSDKKLELDSEQSRWVKELYERYSEGKSIQQLKSHLEANGVRTNRKNLKWTLGSIQNILKNTHPKGEYEFTDTLTDETIVVKCSAIITKKLWEKCQKKREDNLQRRNQLNRTKHFYLLRDFMYCGHCESAMSGRIKEKKNEYLYYCPKKEREWKDSPPSADEKYVRGRGCGMARSLNIPATDHLVWSEVLKKYFITHNFRQKMKQDLELLYGNNNDKEKNIKGLKDKIKRLKRELEGVKESIVQVNTAKLLKKQDPDIADGIIMNLEKEKDRISKDIETIASVLKTTKDPVVYELIKNSGYGAKTTRKVSLDVSKIFTPEVKKKVLKNILEQITVKYDSSANEHHLVVSFKIPLQPPDYYEAVTGEKGKPLKHLDLTLKKNDKKHDGTNKSSYPPTKKDHHG